jgi:hypothetical protein
MTSPERSGRAGHREGPNFPQERERREDRLPAGAHATRTSLDALEATGGFAILVRERHGSGGFAERRCRPHDTLWRLPAAELGAIWARYLKGHPLRGWKPEARSCTMGQQPQF